MKSALTAYPAILLYLTSAGLIALRLFRIPPAKTPPRLLGIALGLVGILFHASYLFQNIFTQQGFNLGFFNAFSLAAWTISLLLLLSALSKPVENLGILVLPLAAVSIVLVRLYPTTHILELAESFGMKLHILVSLLAYSLLALASVQAVLLAIQDQHLRNRHPGGFVRALPPLQTMEALLFEMIGVGFAMLSLALLSGFMFLEDMFAQRLVHKTVLSIAGWFVFGTLLWGRFRFGWRGRTAIVWTLAGFVVLVLAYFGSKAVIELILAK